MILEERKTSVASYLDQHELVIIGCFGSEVFFKEVGLRLGERGLEPRLRHFDPKGCRYDGDIVVQRGNVASVLSIFALGIVYLFVCSLY